MTRPARLMLFVLLVLGALALSAASPDAEGLTAESPSTQGVVVVADRAAGTLSVIDVATDQVVRTVALSGSLTPEPMYVVFVKKDHRIFVGDRANNRVIVLDARDYSVLGTVAAGNGVFHMWAHPHRRQLWVNNDVDNTISVIDTKTLELLATVQLPADLVAQGGRPHDVILDRDAAYVTMIGLAGANDFVVKFDRVMFAEIARAPVGQDPHVFLTSKRDTLYVAAQNSNQVSILDRATLDEKATLAIPGAHGVWIPRSGDHLYVTNLPGGGTDAVFTVDLATNSVLGLAADTNFPVPHNIVTTDDGRKLYVTHSGATADRVSVFSISRMQPIPELLGDVTVGLNPFGLAFVPARGP